MLRNQIKTCAKTDYSKLELYRVFHDGRFAQALFVVETSISRLELHSTSRGSDGGGKWRIKSMRQSITLDGAF